MIPKPLLSALMLGVAPAALAEPAAQPATGLAQQQVEPVDQPFEGEIIVTAPTPEGRVIGNFPPDIEIGEDEIGSYGAASLAELISSVAPLTGSSRGRGEGGPVILLNGKRVSGFGEIRSIPPEAILRIQILPEEAAIAYGYRPEQRVINVILKPDFQAVSADGRLRLATEGGRAEARQALNLFRFSEKGRLSVDFEYEHESPLSESERDIPAVTPAISPDARPFRTLLAESDQYEFNIVYNRAISERIGATLNLSGEHVDTSSGIGLSDDGRPLRGASRSSTGHLGLMLGGALAPWNWSLTANYDHADSRTRTESGLDAPTDYRSRSISDTGVADLVVTGPLAALPAGPLQSTFKLGGDAIGIDSRATRVGPEERVELARQQARAQASLTLPIASRRENILGSIGDLSANLDLGVRHLSDFGTIRTLGYGLSWEPAEQLRLSLSLADEDGAPSLAQLGNPVVVTPNVRIYDFVRGETVDVVSTSGGNPDLAADNRKSFSIGAMLRPTDSPDLTLNIAYTRTRISDPVASAATATATLEAAFPDRFTRDSDGRLVAIDLRPINFAASEQQDLRTSIFFSKSFGTPRAGGDASQLRGIGRGRPGGLSRAGGGEGRGGGRGGFGGMGLAPGEGRLMLSLEHQWRLVDTVLIREGLPEVDLLDGASVGGRSGQPRHSVNVRLNAFKDGIGAELVGSWNAATRLRGAAADGVDDLNFANLAKLDARLFVDFDRKPGMLKANHLLKGSRFSIGIDNIFDAKPRVADASGTTPLSYSPDYLDPLGRTVRLSFRKLF